MLYVTKEDAAAHQHHCVRLTANRMTLSEIDWKGTDELLAEIHSTNSAIYDILVDYLNAYRAWHDYHVWIEDNGKAMRLDDHEKERLRGFIAERNEKRKAIAQNLDAQYPP